MCLEHAASQGYSRHGVKERNYGAFSANGDGVRCTLYDRQFLGCLSCHDSRPRAANASTGCWLVGSDDLSAIAGLVEGCALVCTIRRWAWWE